MRRSGVFRADAAPEGVQVSLGDRPIEAIARALGFPAWFGGNWDALEDCLGDLAEPETLLVLRDFRRNEDLGILIDVLSSAAQFWSEQGRSFAAVFVDPRRELDLPAL